VPDPRLRLTRRSCAVVRLAGVGLEVSVRFSPTGVAERIGGNSEMHNQHRVQSSSF